MESALLVEFPAADSVLDPWRRTFDQGRILGVPAHASVLFPFADPGDLTDADHARLTEIFGTFAPFEAVLTQPRWFGDEVLYLAPEPAATFAAMTAARRSARRRPPFVPTSRSASGSTASPCMPAATTLARGIASPSSASGRLCDCSPSKGSSHSPGVKHSQTCTGIPATGIRATGILVTCE